MRQYLLMKVRENGVSIDSLAPITVENKNHPSWLAWQSVKNGTHMSARIQRLKYDERGQMRKGLSLVNTPMRPTPRNHTGDSKHNRFKENNEKWKQINANVGSIEWMLWHEQQLKHDETNPDEIGNNEKKRLDETMKRLVKMTRDLQNTQAKLNENSQNTFLL